MKALVCHAWGGPSVLKFEEVAPRSLGKGDVRIDVHAADIGFQDVLLVAGRYQLKPEFPVTPGNVVAGTIEECGETVTHLSVGDRVVSLMPHGGYSEEVVVPAGAAFPLPGSVPFVEGPALAMAFATAYQGLVDRAHLARGETLLVRGAGGGVGMAAVEVGRALGAEVIAAASSPEKLAAAKRAGAGHLIDTSAGSIRDRVMEITRGRGADVIFDTLGSDFQQACLRTVARRGRILIVGFAGGEIPAIPAHYILNKFCSVLGVAWGYSVFEKEPSHYKQVLEGVMALRTGNRIGPLALNRIGPQDVVSALSALASRSAIGRTVLEFKQA